MAEILVTSIGYGNQLPEGVGFYDHPDGGSCALTILSNVVYGDSKEEEELAIAYGIYLETLPHIHSVIVHIVENPVKEN